MKNPLYDHGFGKVWTDVFVEERERFKSSITDFHEHDFYEINLVLSGNIKVVVENMTIDGTQNKIVLSKPNSSHFITCRPDVLYSSLYLVFTDDFIKTYDLECLRLLSVFGDKGAIYTITPEQTNTLADIMRSINKEKNLHRKKLLCFFLLSYINDISHMQSECLQNITPYIYQAITYINVHFAEDITAKELADKFYVGRTTFLTEFKKKTGNTFREYITNLRLKNSLKLILEGKSEQEAAICSGFCDSSSLIHCFKRKFNKTPQQYLKNNFTISGEISE